CRQAHDADPAFWEEKFSGTCFYTYALSTGTGPLQGHIGCFHLLDYLTLAEANGWPVLTGKCQAGKGSRILINEIWDVVESGGSLTSFPPHQPEAPLAANASQGGHAAIPAFSLEELHRHLVAFIVQ
ncbi:hypothetical protein PISMIDRAFT_122616, partial [Pisolithus microcarpus 441]